MASFFSMGLSLVFQNFKIVGLILTFFFSKKIQKPFWAQFENNAQSHVWVGRFSLGDSVLIPVLTLKIDYFGWRLGWKSVLRFSPVWELTRRTWNRKTGLLLYTWKLPYLRTWWVWKKKIDNLTASPKHFPTQLVHTLLPLRLLLCF